MWRELREKLEQARQRLQMARQERNAAEKRARFWDELEEGIREAEDTSNPEPEARIGRSTTEILEHEHWAANKETLGCLIALLTLAAGPRVEAAQVASGRGAPANSHLKRDQGGWECDRG
jgi:hypothetical protein